MQFSQNNLSETVFSPFTSHFSRKRCAFTLAEVLITLGIIGVVAALTMPSLIQNYKKQEATAKLKKFYTMLNQAVKLSEIDNGELKTWTRSGMIGGESNYDEDANREEAKKFYNTYLKNYIKSVSESDAYVDPDNGHGAKSFKVTLADGTHFYFRNGSCFDVIYDYNGDKLPNEYGRDRFVLLICPHTGAVKPCAFDINRSRDRDIAVCKSNHYNCSQLLFKDNWEFKDDYPVKL